MIEKPHFIILNGTSSAGKSSIAREMQNQLDAPYLHVELDAFLRMLPERAADYREFAKIGAVLDEVISVFLNKNYNVIFDTVIFSDDITRIRNRLKEFDPFIVCVKADQTIVNEREKQRGDRAIGLAASQAKTIHAGVVYDFEVDTSHITAKEAAEKIAQAYSNRPI